MSETQLLQDELLRLPQDQRESWAGWFRHELAELRAHDAWMETRTPDQLAALRALIQEGIDSGDAGELDADAVIREARSQWNARRGAAE